MHNRWWNQGMLSCVMFFALWMIALTAVAAQLTTDSIVTNGPSMHRLVQPQYITIFINPIASFTASPVSGCAALPVVFTDVSQPGDAPTQSRIQKLDNGNSPLLLPPMHTYTSVKQYSVQLVNVTQSGCRDRSVLPLIETGIPPVVDWLRNLHVRHPQNSVDFINPSNLLLLKENTAPCTVAFPANDGLLVLAGPIPGSILGQQQTCVGTPLCCFVSQDSQRGKLNLINEEEMGGQGMATPFLLQDISVVNYEATRLAWAPDLSDECAT